MSLDTDRIKERIRKLLNVTADNAATEGEIDNAVRMASQLMDSHHLSRADIEAHAAKVSASGSSGSAVSADSQLVKRTRASRTARITQWETRLMAAIATLVGSVEWCYDQRPQPMPVGAFGKMQTRTGITFAGPHEDAQLAVDLFDEWSHVIAAMACGRFNSCLQGPGLAYANGFADMLCTRARIEARKRCSTVTLATQAIVKRTNGSLAHVLEQKRKRVRSWLEQEHGLFIEDVAGEEVTRTEAYKHGQRDGHSAEFSATRKPKLPGATA